MQFGQTEAPVVDHVPAMHVEQEVAAAAELLPLTQLEQLEEPLLG